MLNVRTFLPIRAIMPATRPRTRAPGPGTTTATTAPGDRRPPSHTSCSRCKSCCCSSSRLSPAVLLLPIAVTLDHAGHERDHDQDQYHRHCPSPLYRRTSAATPKPSGMTANSSPACHEWNRMAAITHTSSAPLKQFDGLNTGRLLLLLRGTALGH